MSCNTSAIVVDNVSKCFHTYTHPGDRLKQMCLSFATSFLPQELCQAWKIKAKNLYQEFWALQEVSFEAKRGETIGIVGRNGSGKSTLLQIITGTLTPSSGHTFTQGRIAALLELGSGFNPEFTGLENIYLNASLLGLTRQETDEKLDNILAFADIGDFVKAPVKTYSSGMMVRLAFAVQAQIDPDILIVDEALAVGDAKFQAKCFARLRQLVDTGTTILFVSHSTEQILSHCDKAILLEKGRILTEGSPLNVVNRYLDLLFGKEKKPSKAAPALPQAKDSPLKSHLPLDQTFDLRPYYNPSEYRWGDQGAEIQDFIVYSQEQLFPSILEPGNSIQFFFKITFHQQIIRPIFGFAVKTKEGVTLYNSNSKIQPCADLPDITSPGQECIVKVSMPLILHTGDYFVSVGLASQDAEDTIIPHDRRYDSIHLTVGPTPQFHGLVDLQATIHCITPSSL